MSQLVEVHGSELVREDFGDFVLWQPGELDLKARTSWGISPMKLSFFALEPVAPDASPVVSVVALVAMADRLASPSRFSWARS